MEQTRFAICYTLCNLEFPSRRRQSDTLIMCPVYQIQYLFIHSPLSLGNVLIWSRWCAVGRIHLGCCGRGVTKCHHLVLFRWVAQILGWTTGGRLCSLKSLCICGDREIRSVWSVINLRILFPTFPRVHFDSTWNIRRVWDEPGLCRIDHRLALTSTSRTRAWWDFSLLLNWRDSDWYLSDLKVYYVTTICVVWLMLAFSSQRD